MLWNPVSMDAHTEIFKLAMILLLYRLFVGAQTPQFADKKHAGTVSLGAHYQTQQQPAPLVWSLSDFFFFLLVYLSQLSATYLSSGINTPHLPSAGCSLHHHLLLLSFRFVLLPRSPCVVSKWEDDDDDDGQNAGSVMNPAHLPCASSDSRDLITG